VTGAEYKWIGGRGREEVGKAWESERMEIEAMVEYYAKSVRFGSAKMWVETPGFE
jgi:hypothetical protein